jgi:hypothetical protein
MKKLWSDLPNAHHIDWVLASIKENPTLWDAAVAVVGAAEWGAAWMAVEMQSRAQDAALNAAWVSAVKAAYVADAAWDAAWNAASASLLSLVVYDDCDQYLALGYEKLRVYAALSGKSQAVLLLPMAYVREKMNEKTLV